MGEKSSVSSFLNRVREDFARTNRYLVEMTLPPGIPSIGTWFNSESIIGAISAFNFSLNSDNAVMISCHSCNMPARTLMAYEHTQHSAPFKVPYSQQYEPVTFSFYGSKSLYQRQFFDVWQTAVVNINDNSMNFFEEYTSEVKIWQLDRKGDKTYGVTIYGCWPLAIGDVEYAYSQTDTVTSIRVTLAYKLWKADHDLTQVIIY